MTALVLLCVAVAASVLLVSTLRGQAEQVRYLEGEEAAPVLEVDHLNPRLQRFARDTRLLRVALEDPLRMAQSLERGGLGTALTGRRVVVSDQREGLVGELGRALLVAARDLAEWLAAVERLPPDDRAQLVDRGADWSPLQARFAAQGFTLDGATGVDRRASSLVPPQPARSPTAAAPATATRQGHGTTSTGGEGGGSPEAVPPQGEPSLAGKIGFYVEGLQRIELALARRADPYR